MIKIVLIACMAITSVSAAHAEGEGNGNPFNTVNTALVTTKVTSLAADTGSSAYQIPRREYNFAPTQAGVIQTNSANATISTINSLPR